MAAVKMCAFALAGLLVVGTTAPANAVENWGTANQLMPGCRAYVAGQWFGNAGFCAGQVSGIQDMGGLNAMICVSAGSTLGQSMRVVVQYIDARPARMHQLLTFLAMEALMAAWPCEKR